MAPILAKSQHDHISDMIFSESVDPKIAKAAGCSPRFVRAIRSNICCFGISRAPRIGSGRKRSITLPMLNALCEHLLEKPGQYRIEMKVFFINEFEVLATTFSIERALAFKR